MTVERNIVDGKLEIKRIGSIYRNIGSLRGINPLESIDVDGTEINQTLVKYGSNAARDTDGKFIFYGELPPSIENWSFKLEETYPTKTNEEIPLKQYLFVFKPNTKESKEFRFSRKKS